MDKDGVSRFIQKAKEMGAPDPLIKLYVVNKLSEAKNGLRQDVQSVSDNIENISGKILSSVGKITQRFGNRSSVEKYSGGVNYGTDIAVPQGTKTAVPQGKWKVVEAYDKAQASGPNNPQRGVNKGYGNSVLVQNVETGERLRFSHLSRVNVRPGDIVQGGQVVGLTGATGNVAGKTGQHLDLEYYDQAGRIADILKSKYSKYI